MASPWDYFRAGAQDFGEDMGRMVNGRWLNGPTMTNRQALWDAEPASFDDRFKGDRKMDFSGFGSMAGMMPRGGIPNGGIIGGIQRMMAPSPGAAPAVPADGAMQPTIGPGAAAPAPAAPAGGGILGLLQGQSPGGLIGLLKRAMPGPAAAPLAAMPQAGMLPGMPGSPVAGPVAPPPPQLPTNIDPMNQF
jgi:hypothetical protein